MIKRLIVVALVLVGCSSGSQPPAEIVAESTQQPSVIVPTTKVLEPTDRVATEIVPTEIVQPSATVAVPTPALQPKIGVQVGHWQTEELPAELERFRTSTGAFAAGVSEVEVNLPIAQRVVDILQSQGLNAELLPATVPISYDADVFISIHADGSPSTSKGGFKMATPWRTSPASQHLLSSLEAEYALGTGFERDSAVTFNMRGYYAFSWWRRYHAVAKTTPAVIIEMGFLTNPYERELMLSNPDFFAQSIANGVMRYINERDPNDLAARIPPEHPIQRAIEEGVAVYSTPNEQAEIIGYMELSDRLVPFQLQDGWFEGVVRNKWRTVGWVRSTELIATDEPLPIPESAEESQTETP